MAASSNMSLMMLVALCFSYLICMNVVATPVTSTDDLVQRSPLDHVTRALETVKSMTSEGMVLRRMEMQLNDYPGSGANNRHTPRPYNNYGRGCNDCN